MDGQPDTPFMEMLVEFSKNFSGETILLLVCNYVYIYVYINPECKLKFYVIHAFL